MPTPLQVLAIVLCALTIISDLYAHRVRNIWLLATLLFGTCWMVWAWIQDVAGLPWSNMLGLLAGFLILLPIYIFGWMGAGDVKFFATLGFLLGGKTLVPIWIIASLLAGMHALIIVASRMCDLETVAGILQIRASGSRLWRRVLVARQGRKGLPYAAYMAIGGLCTIYMPSLVHW